MTQNFAAFDEELTSDLPPGVDRLFGTALRFTTDGSTARTVLSNNEDVRLRLPLFRRVEGDFALERFGRGHVCLAQTETPGEVHIEADMQTDGGPEVHFDACVRESWLARTAALDDSVPPGVHVLKGLFRLAEIPQQSTVKVIFRAD
jgi:hypothetical protein